MAKIPSPDDLPFSVQDMRREFDRLLDRVWHGGLNTPPLDGQDWAPSMDVVERNDSYRVRLEVPGLTADDIDVSILEKTLTIKGRKSAPVLPEAESQRIKCECRYGSFLRRYEFDVPVQADNVTARCKHGVLEVIVPKVPEAKGHPVRVQSEDQTP